MRRSLRLQNRQTTPPKVSVERAVDSLPTSHARDHNKNPRPSGSVVPIFSSTNLDCEPTYQASEPSTVPTTTMFDPRPTGSDGSRSDETTSIISSTNQNFLSNLAHTGTPAGTNIENLHTIKMINSEMEFLDGLREFQNENTPAEKSKLL